MKNKDLKKRILDLSYRYNLSHIGSCITAVDIIDEIFQKMNDSFDKRLEASRDKNGVPTTIHTEKFVLSSGHAGLALYIVLEKYGYRSQKNNITYIDPLWAEDIWLHHGVHPDRCDECHIDCSAGSLGNGLPIAVGMALADRKKDVYCLVSDGEVAEGSTYEALNVAHAQELDNLKIYLNSNGWSAYRETSPSPIWFESPNVTIVNTDSDQLPFLHGLDAHYHVMTEEEYKQGLEVLK